MEQSKFEFFGSIATFNHLAGAINGSFDAKMIGFYTGMQCEELAEKLRAIFYHNGQPAFDFPGQQFVEQLIGDLDTLGERLKHNEFEHCCASADPVELLDADVDIQVVSEGSILAQGADGDGARAEVCRSNMDKVVDGKLQRHPDTGKIMKPEGWRAPELAPFILINRE